jgi:hypothetical protein
MTADTLNQTFSIYKALKHSLRVTKRIVESSDQCIRVLHKGTLFWGKQMAEFEPQQVAILSELNDTTVLSLFVAFERELRISIQLYPQRKPAYTKRDRSASRSVNQ